MNQDFTTRLRLELREAALREERRGGPARAIAAARSRPSARPLAGALAAATALAVVLVVAVFMVVSLRPEPAAPKKPRVIADFSAAASLGSRPATAFGSVWLADTARGDVLRVDPRTRRVSARMHVGGADVDLGAGAGSVWAMVQTTTAGAGPLLRIDPRTNRVVARITVRLPEYPGGWQILVGRRVWIVGQTDAVIVDPATNRIAGRVHPPSAFQYVDGTLLGNEVWLVTGDRRMTRYDDRTGRRRGTAPFRAEGQVFADRGRLLFVTDTAAALVDPASGRALWRLKLPHPVRGAGWAAAVAGGRAYVLEQSDSARDRLTAIDAGDGRVAPPLTVPEFGAIAMAGSGRDMWLVTLQGRVVVVRP